MPLDIAKLREQRPQNEWHYLSIVGSTMVEAARLAAGGSPHGTVVIADEQTAGIGRMGRTWISEPEVGIYSSVLLRLPLTPSALPVVSLLVGLATADSIQRVTDLSCDLRWPNDVLIGERKVAGILPQLIDGCVITGIGINVNHTRFPEGLRTPATSLRLASNGQVQEREGILLQLVESLDAYCDVLLTKGVEAILRAFTAGSSYARNRRVIIEETGIEGTTAGLDASGFLLVRTEAGKTQRVSSGGVRPANTGGLS